MRLRLLIILTLTAYIMVSSTTAYATQPPILTDGIVTRTGCTIIGGTIITDTVDSAHTQTVELCQYGSKLFKLIYQEGCFLSVGYWKDPDTGKAYTFPAPCDEPHFCNAPGTRGIYESESYYWYDNYQSTVQVKAEEKQFDILVNSKGEISCNDLNFVQQDMKITIISEGYGSDNFIDVTIPTELLSGEFTVIVGGKNTDVNIQKTETNATITIGLDFSPSTPDYEGGLFGASKKIDIVGTRVIPEFSGFVLIIFGTVLSAIIAARLISKIQYTKTN